MYKFRVWDKLAKWFIYPDKGYQGHYTLSLNGEFYNLQNGSGGKECVVQLYSGIHDKSGQEICEGDIVNIQINDDPEDLCWELWEVRFVKGCFYAFFGDKILLNDFDRDCEVVGNIFEDIDLLK